MTLCAIVGASDFNAEYFRAREQRVGNYACVIAVDGGYASLANIGREPDVLVGDFDSLGGIPETLPEQVIVERHPTQKDESDMELALLYARNHHMKNVHLYGILGGRMDHTLANLQLLTAASQAGLQVCAIDVPRADGQNVQAKVAQAVTFITGPAQLQLSALDSGVVSVFSMTDISCGVSETGLIYGLNNADLSNGASRGLSNEMCGNIATISVEQGTLAIFHPLIEC